MSTPGRIHVYAQFAAESTSSTAASTSRSERSAPRSRRLAQEVAPAFLVASALGAERRPLGPVEIPPLADEDGRHADLLRDDAEVRAQREANPLEGPASSGTPSSPAWKEAAPSRVISDEELLLRLGERVERPLLDPHRLCEIGHRGAVVAVLREESRRDGDELLAPGRHVLHATDRSAGARRGSPQQEFLAYVQAGGLVETGDWMPDEYRARLMKFIEMHANSELMGVLPERDWILRAPTLQRKLALTAKIQDEVGHASSSTAWSRTSGSRASVPGRPISGRSKFHNVFHYPTRSWGDVGVIAWLVDAAAIISQKALLKCSYAPYARIMRKICWEESFHILHGRDVVLDPGHGHDEQRELVQEASTAGGSR